MTDQRRPFSAQLNPGASTQSDMDQTIETRLPRWLVYVLAAVAIIIALIAGLSVLTGGLAVFSVSRTQLATGEVTLGVFEDFIPVRGLVRPAQTVYLDTIEGGLIDEILVENGEIVEIGQPIVRLANASLQLSVIAREAEISQQLNNLRTLELELQRNELGHRRRLIELNYEITRLSRELERRRVLAERGVSTPSALEELEDELAFNLAMRDLTIASQQTDRHLQGAQLSALSETTDRLERNLSITQSSLNSLEIVATVSGQLTAFNAVIGQSIGVGERLGQIDSPNAFKVRADVDEFYLDRIMIGQEAHTELNGGDMTLRVSRIVPEVRNGMFAAELEFEGPAPADLRRGQTLQLRLQFGSATDTLMMPYGSFYEQTGGGWVFVLEPDGQTALRRDVRLGRHNSQYVEVLDGLTAGERVITSSYERFGNADRIDLKG
tara:strand:+ start:31544 stop:32857 length:1314 start_codon:yes stop_codon:yes gene_type:complete